jgi:hypothetical protein
MSGIVLPQSTPFIIVAAAPVLLVARRLTVVLGLLYAAD